MDFPNGYRSHFGSRYRTLAEATRLPFCLLEPLEVRIPTILHTLFLLHSLGWWSQSARTIYVELMKSERK
jgi:hypothetical protein